MKKWLNVILLVAVLFSPILCYGGATDYVVDNNGVVHAYGFSTPTILPSGLLTTGIKFGTMTDGRVCTYASSGTLLSCDTTMGVGSGTVTSSGNPTNHQWPGWTSGTNLKGFTVTASKPVCTDASGDPAVCAGTEGVWATAGHNHTGVYLAAGATAVAASDLIFGSDARGDIAIRGASTYGRLAKGNAAYKFLRMNSGDTDPEWSTATIDDSTSNVTKIANGTSSLQIKAGQAINFTGTFTDTKVCTYTASGTEIGCNTTMGLGDVTGPATNVAGGLPLWDTANSKALAAGLTPARGSIMTGQGASPTWATLAKGNAAYKFLRMNAGDTEVEWSTATIDDSTSNVTKIANGTSSLSVKAGQALNFTGTFTDTKLCTYTSSGTEISCNTTVGAGDVVGPATHAANLIPQWNGTPDSKTLVAGLTLDADCSAVSASDDSVCSAKTTRTQLDLKQTKEIPTGGGTAQAITADYTVDVTLADKTLVMFRSAAANTATAPTFAPDGLTARDIVKQGGAALVAGDIGAAGFIAILQYDLANTRWELLNPIYPPGQSSAADGARYINVSNTANSSTTGEGDCWTNLTTDRWSCYNNGGINTYAILGANAFTGAQTFTGSGTLTSPPITTDLHSIAAGSASVGTSALPFSTLIFAGANSTPATNHTILTPGTNSGEVTITLPTTTGTLVASGGALGTDATMTTPKLTTGIKDVNGDPIIYVTPKGGTVTTYLKVLNDGSSTSKVELNAFRAASAVANLDLTTTGGGVVSVNGANILTSTTSGVQTFLDTPSSANLATILTNETGSGAAVFADTPTLTTPIIGAATGTSLALTGNLTGLLPSVLVTLPSGTDSASTGAAFLTHADDSSATGEYIGLTLYNVTDGSSCTVTASTNTTTTCTLAGGSANHWDSTNVYQLGPGPSQSGSMFYVTGAGNFRWPATIGYGGCVMSNGTANVHVVPASATMTFKGTLDTAIATTSAGHYIESSGSTGDDFMCLHNLSATVMKGLGKRGTWAKEADD